MSDFENIDDELNPNYVDLGSEPGELESPSGPRTPQGKERSKHNALKHGIFSKIACLNGESAFELQALFDGLREDFAPEGTLEETLVEKLATLFWRYRRLLNAEGMEVRNAASRGSLGDFLGVGSLLRYEASLDRSLDRTLKQLERVQRIRLGLAVSQPVDVNVSC